MSDEDLQKVLAEVRALRIPPELLDKLRILSELLQKSLEKQIATGHDLRGLLGDVHHDLQWLRKHVAELTKHLAKLGIELAIDAPGETPTKG